MINLINDIKNKTMTEQKKQAKDDYFAYYVGRPLFYILTVPFFKMNIKPYSIFVVYFSGFYRIYFVWFWGNYSIKNSGMF